MEVCYYLLPTCTYSPHPIMFVQRDVDDELWIKNNTAAMSKENLSRLTLANNHFNAEKERKRRGDCSYDLPL